MMEDEFITDHEKNLRALLCGDPNAFHQFVQMFRYFLFRINGAPFEKNKEAKEIFEFMTRLVYDCHRSADHDEKIMPIPNIMLCYREYIKLKIEEDRLKRLVVNQENFS